jgi:pimeloyl-ACP methyl ester carboxylesterase
MEEAFKSGDIARSVEISLQIWTDGPFRTPQQVDPQVRERVRAMTTHNFERGDDEEVRPQHIEPPAAGRLPEINVPARIIVGSEDVEIILSIADKLEKDIGGAKKVVIPGTAHHLNMEKPREFNRVVIDFLEEVGT